MNKSQYLHLVMNYNIKETGHAFQLKTNDIN